MCLIIHRKIRCEMFRDLTHFDALLRFDGNAHFLPIRVFRTWLGSSALLFLTSYSQLFAYQCFQQTCRSLSRVPVVNQDGHELSASPSYFCSRNFQKLSTEPNELLDNWLYIDSMCPEPRAWKGGVMVSGLNSSLLGHRQMTL